MEEREIWANAVLKDGKLLFWWTGGECQEIYDFNKDFLYSGLKMNEEIGNHDYKLVKQEVPNVYDTSFYEQFEFHEDYKGIKPY